MPHSRKHDLSNLVIAYSRRLQKLKEKRAYLGLDTPPHIEMEIEDIEASLKELMAKSAGVEETGFDPALGEASENQIGSIEAGLRKLEAEVKGAKKQASSSEPVLSGPKSFSSLKKRVNWEMLGAIAGIMGVIIAGIALVIGPDWTRNSGFAQPTPTLSPTAASTPSPVAEATFTPTLPTATTVSLPDSVNPTLPMPTITSAVTPEPTLSPTNMPTPETKPQVSNLIIRVVNDRTGEPAVQTLVQVWVEGNLWTQYTDNTGVALFSDVITQATSRVRISITAAGYKEYDLISSVSQRGPFVTVRLTPGGADN